VVVIESVVTTLDAAGEVNFAAMGVVWGDETITIRPFTNTRTYRNLTTSGEAVVNVTDNVLVFAKSALSTERFECLPARSVRGVVLREACSWREVRVEGARAASPATASPATGAVGRAEILARVVARGEGRPFVGLCRAKHAVVEASILASRFRRLPHADLRRDLDRLEELVRKTGGVEERDAMDFIRAYLDRRMAAGGGQHGEERPCG
jgi:uncharacterized protein